MGRCHDALLWDLVATIVLFCYGRRPSPDQYALTSVSSQASTRKSWRYAARRNRLLSTHPKSVNQFKSLVYAGLATKVTVQRTQRDAIASLAEVFGSVLSHMASTVDASRKITIPAATVSDTVDPFASSVYTQALRLVCRCEGLEEIADVAVTLWLQTGEDIAAMNASRTPTSAPPLRAVCQPVTPMVLPSGIGDLEISDVANSSQVFEDYRATVVGHVMSGDLRKARRALRKKKTTQGFPPVTQEQFDEAIEELNNQDAPSTSHADEIL